MKRSLFLVSIVVGFTLYTFTPLEIFKVKTTYGKLSAKILFLLLLFLTGLNFTSLLWAGSSSTLTTEEQFRSNENEWKNELQIEGAGTEATLKLRNAWTNLNLDPTNSPPTRKYSPLAYDSLNKKIILFGGLQGSSTDLNDTWLFSPSEKLWEDKNVSNSPPARSQHILVYLGNGKTVLFGGKDKDNYFNDTWIFNGSNWSKKSYNIALSSRAAASVVAISTNSLILFGGYNQGGRLNETWRYDLEQDNWTKLSPPNSPSVRDSAGMAYDDDPQENKIVLFGGSPDGSNYFNDTWVYSLEASSWTKKIPSSSPSERSSPLVYDSLNDIFMLFGGQSRSEIYADTWFYDLNTNEWRQVTVSSSPPACYGHGLTYTDENKVYLFGGIGASDYNDTWSYVFRSSGTYTSPVWVNANFTTSLVWEGFNISPEIQPGIDKTELKFEILTSTDNSNWLTTGPDPYSNPLPGARRFIPSEHNDQRYFKFRAYFKSIKPPNTPELDSFTVFFNRAPDKPIPVFPEENIRLNDQIPFFTWQNANDLDSDSLTYQLQVDLSTSFAPPKIDIPQIVNTSTKNITTLSEGKWYWRVRANDGVFDGNWSEIYNFFIDITPPAGVNDLTATIGEKNGEILLSWTDPSADGTTNEVSTSSYKGGYVVKWSSVGTITETNWQEIVSSKTWTGITILPNNPQTKTATGLQNGTTYYFCLQVMDEPENLSPLSNNATGFTNAPPEIILISPQGGEYGTEKSTNNPYVNISWTYSDPNVGDTHSFHIYLSTADNGDNYTILITSGLPNGTTFYLWDSRQVKNGKANRIKVIANDKRGLTGENMSANFTVSNLNESPEISIIYPKNEIISGTTYFHWTYSDPNQSDRHSFQIYLSTDEIFLPEERIVQVSDQNYYLFYSTNYPNQIDYQLKIRVEDESKLWKEDSSVFGIANYNLPPSTFSLISPQLGRLYSFPLIFWWEEAVDPNDEDEVTYTLYFSTDDKFSIAQEIKNLKDNFYHLPFFFEEEKNYYWKVRAEDPFGLFTWSNQTNYLVTVSRKKVLIDDLYVEVSTGLPGNGYLRVDKIYPEDYSPLSWANQRSLTDPMTRKIYADGRAYRIGIYDTGDKLISPAGIKLTILYGYTDKYKDGYLDYTNIPVNNLRICKLEENVSSAFWSPAAVYPQGVISETKNVSASLEYPNGFPGIIVSLLGYAPATVYLSEVANYPNPFNPEKQTTRIEYVLTQESDVTIRIYNLVGDLVWTKENAQGLGQPEGKENQEEWNGKNDVGMIVANGMYLCLISARPVQGGEERKISRLIGVIK